MYDVLIAGYGPTGMMAAILLGRAGHRVAIIERHRTLYNLPRVGIVHDDILRMFQEIGISERVQASTFFLPRYEMANQGRVLLSNDVSPLAAHGWPEMTSIYQPAFEAELDIEVRNLPSVDLFLGETMVGLSQDPDVVTVTTQNEDGQTRQVQGRYLIGSDGGNSLVRRSLGIGYEDLGFDQDWLVIDARARKPQRADLPHLRQFCEPAQPGMTMRMGPDHRRWSFMIFKDESRDEAVKAENVWRRLDRAEGGTPDEFELVRVVTYKFQSLMAQQWRVGRVFLAGDAAHQMPPFLAQGLCSGFRDGYNLAWKLDLVLKGEAASGLLDTYAQEREPNSRATVVESMRVGQNVNERDPERVRLRDEQLLAAQAAKEGAPSDKRLIAFRVPGFSRGLVAHETSGVRGAGDVFPQGRVQRAGHDGRFDDVAGRGFMVLGRSGDPKEALSPHDVAWWENLGGRFGRLDDDIVDADGTYQRLLDDYDCDIIVKRRDYYTFGACRTGKELPALMADLRGQLQAG